MADASDSKSDGGDIVWVRLPPSAVESLINIDVTVFVVNI